MKEKMANFIFGIIAFGSYVYIYISSGLNAMAVVAFVQTVFLIYGWYFWKRNKKGNEVPVTNRFTRKQLIFRLTGMGIAWLIWGYLRSMYYMGHYLS